jgi:polysaccharide export outer membrane protein
MRKLLLLSAFAGTIVFCGCASRRDVELSDLLRDLDLAEPTAGETARDPNGPDMPVSGLPPEPAVGSSVAILQGGITIQPDCLLQIRVEEDPSLDGSYPVNEIGAVELGYVGPVILLNKTEKEAEQKIAEVLEYRDFRRATVNVRILRASYDKVRVVGAVGQSGIIRIGAGDNISLNDALLRAGGLKAAVRGTRVRVIRNGQRFAVWSALEGEEYELVDEDGIPVVPNVWLRNNDIAFVYSKRMERGQDLGGREILVLGEVNRKGIYRFAGAEPFTLMHLIFKMGGLPRYANPREIRIIRRDEEGAEDELVVDATRILDEGDPEEDVPLQDGDRIIVPSRGIAFF